MVGSPREPRVGAAATRSYEKLEVESTPVSCRSGAGLSGRGRRGTTRSARIVSPAELLYALSAAAANLLGALAVTSRTRWSVRAFDAILSLAAGFLISVS